MKINNRLRTCRIENFIIFFKFLYVKVFFVRISKFIFINRNNNYQQKEKFMRIFLNAPVTQYENDSLILDLELSTFFLNCVCFYFFFTHKKK